MAETTTIQPTPTELSAAVTTQPTTTVQRVDIASMFGVSQQDLKEASNPAPTTRDFTQVTADILGVQLPTTSTVPPTQTIAGSDASVQLRTDLPPTLTTVLGTTSTAVAPVSTAVAPVSTPAGATPVLQTGVPSVHDQLAALDKKLDLVLQQLAGTSAITAAAVPAAVAALSTGTATVPKVGLDAGLSWNSIFPAKTGGRRKRTARKGRARRRTTKKRV